MYTNFRVQRYGSPRLSKSHSLIILKTAVLQLGVINIMLLFQNYTIGNLQKHTNYVITLAAKNLKGLGPNATIELRTEDGGNSCEEDARMSMQDSSLRQTLCCCPMRSLSFPPFTAAVIAAISSFCSYSLPSLPFSFGHLLERVRNETKG